MAQVRRRNLPPTLLRHLLDRIRERVALHRDCQFDFAPGRPLTCAAAIAPRMHLSPREQEKLLVVVAADLARRRQARGLKLNYPEVVAILTAEIMEGARDGRSVAELMSYGTTILGRTDVMEGVAEMIHDVQVEATFPDGTKLVTVHHPVR